jgi:PKHD-type hydroxylase
MANKVENAAWSFELDPINYYAYWNNAFSKIECEKIINIAKDKGLIKGTIFNDEDSDGIRDSKIVWLYSCDNLDWAFRRVTDIILDLNNKYFKFDLFGMLEGFQFTNYTTPGGKYGRHIDSNFNIPVRKLSISIQLTDPKEYEGGELYLYHDEKGKVMDKEQGTLIVFPSYTLHEVMPVTKGERNSLVSWVTGKPFK